MPLRVRRKRLTVLRDAPAPVTPRRPLDGYVRVSRVDGREGESFISPSVQEERIRAYTRSHGLELANVYRELDRSGADENRPLFLEALARVGRESGGIVVATIDRFARSALDALNAIHRIEAAGGLFISVDEGFDSSTPFGRAMMTILLALAELELVRAREIWDVAQARAVARGVHTPPQTPAGYRRGADGRLVPDPVLAPLIVEAFRRRSEGSTFEAIAKWLSREAALYRHDGFRRAGVSKLLKSRVYLGEAYYGRYRNPSAHPAIVPVTLWLAAQSTAPTHFRHPRAETLLSGLARCAGCSHLLASSWTRRGGGTEREARLVSYGCRRDRKTELCPQPARARAADLEELIVDHFFALLRRRQRRRTDELALAGQKLAALDAELARLGRPLSANGASSDDNPDALTALYAAKEEAALNVRLALRRASFDALPPARTLERRWRSMATAARRQALAAAFDAVFVERGDAELAQRVHFVRAGALPDGFPRQGRPAPSQPWPSQSSRNGNQEGMDLN